mmetsp:Transcript_13691/g.33135  ORF Transcript_13691/g.33135 Transcript_13691/m.33135 type:complete len:636 (-) Transcript_13691:918-2825(-)
MNVIRRQQQQAQNATMNHIDHDNNNLQTNDRGENDGVQGGGSSSSSHNNKLNRRSRPSPVRMRNRGQSSSSSSTSRSVKTKNGHVTNINKINVINNFGDRRAREHFGWCILRTALATLLIIWFGAMASVMRSAPPSSPSTSKSAMSLERWKDLSDNAQVRLGAPMVDSVQALPPPADDNSEGAAEDGKNEAEHNAKDATNAETASIFELSIFGTKNPTDFQLYTPHAQSCSRTLDAQSISFTLVSQLSNDRLWMVQYHCERWGDNPMSIVVFTDRTAVEVKSELVSQGCSYENLNVQTVSRSKYDPDGTEYPVNLLRNMAFSAVRTTHIVYADVDFWPASDLHSILSSGEIKERFASDPKLATVIPVFQMSRRCKEYKDCRDVNIPVMPRDKEGLLALIRKKHASTFDPTNVGGHGSTKYITWRDQQKGVFVDLPCIKSNRYEPYLAFRYCSDLPPFQEGFTGYGKNKMTWVMQLRRAGYLFSQLGGAFLVHYPHLDSKARLEWNKKPRAMEKYHKSAVELRETEGETEAEKIDWASFKRARVDALFLDFKEWLDGTVEDESRVPMCADALNDDMRLWVHSAKQATDDDDAAESEDADVADEEGDEQAANGGESTEEDEDGNEEFNEQIAGGSVQ